MTFPQRLARTWRATVAALSVVIILSTFGCGHHSTGVVVPLITSNDTDDQPAWSHDGSTIAYRHIPQVISATTAPPGIYLVRPNGSAKRLLVAGAYLQPVWSPDDRLIACRSPSGELCLIDVQSGDVAIIGFPAATSPTWSPDGGMLAFDSPAGDPRGARSVWIAFSDGTGARDIGQHGLGEWRAPDWSPDGRRLVYQRYYVGTGGSEISLVDTSGAELARLTHDDAQDLDPRWSPDGRYVAWTHIANRDVAVWIMSATGRERWRVTSGNEASWSPDGTRLVFARSVGTGGTQLYVVGGLGTGTVTIARVETRL